MEKTVLGETNPVRPSELMRICANTFAGTDICRRVVCLQGVYMTSKKLYSNDYFYDKLVDDVTDDEVTIMMPQSLRSEIGDGDIVKVHGVLDWKPWGDAISLMIAVSQAESVDDVALSQRESKIEKLLNTKEVNGKKDVEALLTGILREGRKPRVALIYSEQSVVRSDFSYGIGSAIDRYEIQWRNANMTDPSYLCRIIREIDDAGNCDVIAVSRGGGSRLNRLNNTDLLETVAGLRTPWIYGIGHADDKLVMRKLADADISSPTGLGNYLRDIVAKADAGKDTSAADAVRMAVEMSKMRNEIGAFRRRLIFLRCACVVLAAAVTALVIALIIAWMS